jgi:hypothetical protein
MIRFFPPRSWPLDAKILHFLLVLLKFSVLAAIGWALLYGKWEFFFLCSLALLLMYLPEFIESRVKVSLPIEFDLVLVVFIYAAIFLGEAIDAYERFWWWDAALHISSGIIIGFAGFLMLYVQTLRGKISASPMFTGLIIFSFALAFGAIWEVFEYSMDQTFGLNMQKNGLQDTMSDLIVDGWGALAMAFVGARFIGSNGQGIIRRWVQKFINANPHLEKLHRGRPNVRRTN